ncbi:hypothetical protein FA95DRAFT_1611948 [Auriscalpium vulgare]|uniref:Uncharacterized protein n=1 Tax=Auriscalpium vulgare TaxID=40419 RepID=A0ACB8R9K1_9AGAM|nr:hypothetical protein FA95DRAFT_1611948 [Auriscalpium vulgare]
MTVHHSVLRYNLQLAVARLQAMSVRPVFLSVLGDCALVNHVINIWPSIRIVDLILRGTDSSNEIALPRELQTLATSVPNRRMAPALHDLELLEPLSDLDLADAAPCATLVQSGLLT